LTIDLHNRWILNKVTGLSQLYTFTYKVPSWWWSHGSCSQCISPLKLWDSNLVHGEVYSKQHYIIKFVSDLRQVGGFLWELRFPPPNKTDHHDIAKILLKMVLNTLTLALHSNIDWLNWGQIYVIKEFPVYGTVFFLFSDINELAPLFGRIAVYPEWYNAEIYTKKSLKIPKG
jgi:hypothetical protein